MTRIKESGFVPHNIVIEAPEAGMKMREAMTTQGSTVRFTPSKSGKYMFYCDKWLLFFKSHRERGMEGVIEVIQ